MKGKGKLLVEINEEGKLVTINVSDTGNGIPKINSKIFSNQDSPPKKRLGLGLS